MRRICIFAHYDGQNRIKPYIRFHLKALRALCDEIHFVSTSVLDEADCAGLAEICASVTLTENKGADFGMWQKVILRLHTQSDWTSVDEIVLTNSSVFGPVCPLAPLFERMADAPLDAWGLTDSHELSPHYQSYFLVFRRTALENPAFLQFWRAILPYKNKNQLIKSFEIGLSLFLEENEVRMGACFPLKEFAHPYYLRDARTLASLLNPPMCFPVALLERGFPYVKVELLRENPLDVPLAPLYRAMAAKGYDMGLIQFDR
jgi:rhamnosyltransferase